MPALLQIRQLLVSIDDIPLIGPLDLDVAGGQRIAIVGPSGAGKSMLLRAIAGLVPADGDVRLDGEAAEDAGYPAFRRAVTYVAQRPALVPGSVETNLRRPFEWGHAGRRYDDEEARNVLAAFGLAATLLERETQTLSVGEAQRVCLARTLLLRPRAVLLDEPTSALDTRATLAVEAAISDRCSAAGLAAIIVTHSPDQAARWCQRTVDVAPLCHDNLVPAA